MYLFGWGSDVDNVDIREAVEAAVAAVFEHRDQQSNLDRDTHAQHHQWLAQRIAREAEGAEFWRNLKTRSLPWAIVVFLGWAASTVWAFIAAYVTGHWK